MGEMFCFQCEQTAGCKGCTGMQGVCGKKKDTALLQDELTGVLIDLAGALKGRSRPDSADRIMIEGLFTTVTNVNFDSADIGRRIEEARGCSAIRTAR